jgi:heme exporter protein C
MLVCWLMYAGYLMLRRAIEEPTERAKNSAVLSIFIFPGVYITWKSIEWWRTQHPGPVLSVRKGGGMAPGMEAAMWWNALALGLLAVVLVLIRLRQEQQQRQVDALRRTAHAL